MTLHLILRRLQQSIHFILAKSHAWLSIEICFSLDLLIAVLAIGIFKTTSNCCINTVIVMMNQYHPYSR
jgi:hypothetical protein